MNGIVIGRLTCDPEAKITQTDRKYCNFDIAENDWDSKKKERITRFIRCTAWNGFSERLRKALKKGSQCQLIGKLTTELYREKIQYNLEVTSFELIFSGTANSNGDKPKPEESTPDAPAPTAAPARGTRAPAARTAPRRPAAPPPPPPAPTSADDTDDVDIAESDDVIWNDNEDSSDDAPF